MKALCVFLIFLCFFACTKDDEIGTKTDNDYCNKLPAPSPKADSYDEYFKYQWHLASNEYFSINVVPAWERTKGAGIKVAVLDDGIQKNHEDFENINVYNILDESNDCEPSLRTEYSHGTAVSGVIAARQNGVGTIGVAPECDLLFIGDSSYDIYSDAVAIKAFEYAKNWGARVISCSWGSYNVSSTLSSQIKNLYENGITIVFACGNDSKNMDALGINDESELPWVIGVSMSDENGYRAYRSNYGNNIDIMAPGTLILMPDLMGIEGDTPTVGYINENYTFSSGTSFSTPIVAGVAALMLAANPSLTPSEIRTIITQTAQKTGNVQYDANGFSLYNAFGLINAAEAVKRAYGNCGNVAISE
jgi:subtilisin family serine protease